MSKKITLTNHQKYQLMKFRKGLSSYLVTRWIYLGFFIISSLGTICLQIFLGSFSDWVKIGNDSDSVGVSMGVMTYALIILSIPRLIGNILYIYQLKKTAQAFQDKYFYRAYRKQQFRVACYIVIFLILIILINTITNVIYNNPGVFGFPNNIGEFLSAIGNFPSKYGLTPGIVFSLILYGLVTFTEKILNISTWNDVQTWFKNQKQVVEENLDQTLDTIVMAGEYIKIGNIVTFFEGTIGNILFNVGLYRMQKELPFLINNLEETYNTGVNIYVPPKPSRSSYYYNQYSSIESQVHRKTVETPRPAQTVRPADPSDMMQKNDIEISVNYCGYCGKKVTYENAIFCSACGQRL